MRNGNYRDNNRGSALIAVIISMLFIGIIASIVLFVSRSNLMVSEASKNSTTNFYGGEKYLDELKAKLKELADEAVKDAYVEWLNKYTTEYSKVPLAQQSNKFYELFLGKFENLPDVKDYFNFTDESGHHDAANDDFGGLLLNAGVNLTPGGAPDIEVVTEKQLINGVEQDVITGIRIKDISVTTTDEKGDLTTITTDLIIKVEIPAITVKTGIRSNFANFALITDKALDFNNAFNVKIIGSVYGGGKADDGKYNAAGISLNNGANVELDSNLIITRASIDTTGDSKLTIYGKNGDPALYGSSYANIWANNIRMGRNDGTLVSKKSTIEIEGNCYIADDLTIDGDESKIELLNGSKYIGYSYNTSTSADEADTSSSIVVNGKNVTLDFHLADKLWLFGKSYVEVPRVWGYREGQTAYFEGSSQKVTSKTFMQGESISYRSLQAAYLLPGECIVPIKHNPMSEEDYDSIKDNLSSELVINIDLNNNSGIRLRDYLKKDDYVTAARVQYGTGENRQTLVYLYMNFATPDKAAAYMQAYKRRFTELTESRVKMSDKEGGNTLLWVNTGAAGSGADGEDLLDNGRGKTSYEDYTVINTGNILTYDGSNIKLYSRNIDYIDQFILTQKDSLKRKYQSYQVALESGLSGSLSTDLTTTIVNFAYITNERLAAEADPAITYYPVKRIIGDDGTQYKYSVTGLLADARPAFMVTTDENVTVESDGKIKLSSGYAKVEGSDDDVKVKAGIIITSGTVTLESGASFWGTIIAQNGIKVKGTCTDIHAAYDDIKVLLRIGNKQVVPYFSSNEDVTTVEGDLLENFISVEFDRWKKD